MIEAGCDVCGGPVQTRVQGFEKSLGGGKYAETSNRLLCREHTPAWAQPAAERCPTRPSPDALWAAARLLRGPVNDLNARAGVLGMMSVQVGGLAAVEAAEADLRRVVEWLEWEAEHGERL